MSFSLLSDEASFRSNFYWVVASGNDFQTTAISY